MTGPDYIKQVPQSTILVVDDEDASRAVIRASLGRDEFNVIEASNGREAIDLCRNQLPDLVVTDLMMPDVDGAEFVRWFRNEFSDPYVPVLMLTARDEIEEKEKGFALGIDDYLTKPFNYRELSARVSALLRIKHLTDILLARTRELQQANEELARVQQELLRKEREMVAMQLAGAAAHNLGQPVTSILLNCSVLEKILHPSGQAQEMSLEEIRRAVDAATAIKKECALVQDLLGKLRSVDPETTQQYLAGVKILDLK